MTASEMRHEVGTARTVADAVAAVTEALARRQFSVLWDLDVNAKLREKGLELGVPYRILEVCSAPRAKQAIETNPHVGYFLPCKVVVYAAEGGTRIGLVRPQALIDLVEDPRLADLAAEVERTLIEAIAEAAG